MTRRASLRTSSVWGGLVGTVFVSNPHGGPLIATTSTERVQSKGLQRVPSPVQHFIIEYKQCGSTGWAARSALSASRTLLPFPSCSRPAHLYYSGLIASPAAGRCLELATEPGEGTPRRSAARYTTSRRRPHSKPLQSAGVQEQPCPLACMPACAAASQSASHGVYIFFMEALMRSLWKGRWRSKARSFILLLINNIHQCNIP